MTSKIYHFINFSKLSPSRRFTDVPSGGSSPGPARLSGPPLSQRPGSARLVTLPARSEGAVTTTAMVVPARKAGPGRLAGAVAAAQLTGPVRLAGAGPPSPLLCSPGTFTFTRQEKAVSVLGFSYIHVQYNLLFSCRYFSKHL